MNRADFLTTEACLPRYRASPGPPGQLTVVSALAGDGTPVGLLGFRFPTDSAEILPAVLPISRDGVRM